MKHDTKPPGREVPDTREFLTREGRILAEAEALARTRFKRRMLLINCLGALAFAALLGLIFWLVNHR